MVGWMAFMAVAVLALVLTLYCIDAILGILYDPTDDDVESQFQKFPHYFQFPVGSLVQIRNSKSNGQCLQASDIDMLEDTTTTDETESDDETDLAEDSFEEPPSEGKEPSL